MYERTIAKVGFDSQGAFKATVGGKPTSAHSAWTQMLYRCYSEALHKRKPWYVGCSVAPEWHDFQEFASWYYRQRRGQGWHLDKDIVIRGNKMYSPDTCALIPPQINTLLNINGSRRGTLPIGVVSWAGKYMARIRIYGERIHLGTYTTPEAAHIEYKRVKEAHIKQLVDYDYATVLDNRVKSALLKYIVNAAD